MSVFHPLTATLVILSMFFLPGCKWEQNPPRGGLGERCQGDQSCDKGLTCQEGLCVVASADASSRDQYSQDQYGDSADASGVDSPPVDVAAVDTRVPDAAHSDVAAVDGAAVDGGRLDAAVDVDAGERCQVVIAELEDAVDNSYWAVCPGVDCEDDQSATASAGAHLCTHENNYSGDPGSGVELEVTLHRGGTFWIWARSVRIGPSRAWGLTIDGVADPTQLGVAQRWQRIGPHALTAGRHTLRVVDLAPDGYWAYPDVAIVVDDPDFDPVLCADQGVSAATCVNWCQVAPHDAGSGAPQADFTAETTAGTAPLSVAFSNSSSGDITQYVWSFGDGETSTEQHPEHTYQQVGHYTVTLQVSGPGGADSVTRQDYIQVYTHTPLAWDTSVLPPLDFVAQDPNAMGYRGAPIWGGIPFARGALPISQLPRIAITDRNDQAVPAFGAHPLGTWPDGSVKWLLVEFAGSHSGGDYRLGISSEPVAGDGLTVVDQAGGFWVDTGVMRAHLPKDGFAFLDQVWVDLNGNDLYDPDEQVVSTAGELFIDLDDQPPGAADTGAYEHPTNVADYYRGMEGGNWLRDSQSSSSTRYRASLGEYSVQLVRSSKAQAVFKVEGWHRQEGGTRDFGKYTLYLQFFYRLGVVRVMHTWIMTGDPDLNFVRRMALEVPFTTGDAQLGYAFGGAAVTDGTPVYHNAGDPPFVPRVFGPSQLIEGSIDPSQEVAIASIGPDKYYHNIPLGEAPPVEYTVYRGGQVVASGESASGWGYVRDSRAGLSMGVRDFWQEHPKEVKYNNGTMAAYIWPDKGNKTLDMRRRYDQVRGVKADWGLAARRVFNNPGSAVGVAKSTELYVAFGAASKTPAEVDRQFLALQDPARPFVSATHNTATGVFGPMQPYNPQARPQIENYLDLMMARIIRSKREYAWVGMYDYGDYLPEFEKQNWELDLPNNPNLYSNWGYAGWLQENYRFGQWAFVQYYRSGRYRYWRAADTWLRHTRDVDCVFWEEPDDGPRPSDNRTGQRLGGGHRHDQQHWGTYMAGYGQPTIAVVHHYYMSGEGRDLDAMRDYISWLRGSGDYYERHGEYSALYMGEALGDQDAIDWALDHYEQPRSGYGRATYDSGMGLMMHDIHTGGGATVRAKLRTWADLDEATASYLRGYLKSVESSSTYNARIQADWDTAFPADPVRARRYEQWAPRVPTDFRDAFSADIMPQGPWDFPIRSLESIQFDGPGGMGYDLGRHSTQMALIWLMPHVAD